MTATHTTAIFPHSALLALTEERAERRSQQQMMLIRSMARRMHATEALAALLQHEGFSAIAAAEDDSQGIPFPAVMVRCSLSRLMTFLTARGIHFEAIDKSQSLQIYTFSATVTSQSVSVIVRDVPDDRRAFAAAHEAAQLGQVLIFNPSSGEENRQPAHWPIPAGEENRQPAHWPIPAGWLPLRVGVKPGSAD